MAAQPAEDERVTGVAAEDAVAEHVEVALFQVHECYVYKIPPRKVAASYRADEWDINKWAWEGALRVVAKGEDCRILLEDNKTSELFAQAPVRKDQPLPVEAVIDSSRFFVLRIEDQSGEGGGGGGGGGGQVRHAFVGLGFRERPQAYDFQAALHDHLQYLRRKEEAQEMEHEYQSKPSADYSLKEGETLRLAIKKPSNSGAGGGSYFKKKVEELRNQQLAPDSPTQNQSFGGNMSVPVIPPPLVPPPPPPSLPASPLQRSIPPSPSQEDDDFGDFQAA